MTITKELIDACEGLLKAHRLTFKRPPDTMEKIENELADIRSAVAKAEEVIQKAKEAIQYPTETAWLVENGKQGDELRYRTWKDGFPTWTADPNEATRYCRRIDAEQVHLEDEDAWRIVQHAWHHMPANGQS